MKKLSILPITAALLAALLMPAATRLLAQRQAATAPSSMPKRGCCSSAEGYRAIAADLAAAMAEIDKARKATDSGKQEAARAALVRARELVKAAHDRVAKKSCAGCRCKGAACPKCRAGRNRAPRQPAKCVNTKCPIMGGAIDPAKVPAELSREFRGQRIGFCCAGCPAAWDKLDDAEKQARLEKARAR